MPQSPAGTYDRPHDAHDQRDRVSGHTPARRGGHGAGEGDALFWYGRETGMSYALQCHYDGDDLAYGGYQGCQTVEKAAGHRECAAEGLCVPELSALSRRHRLGA